MSVLKDLHVLTVVVLLGCSLGSGTKARAGNLEPPPGLAVVAEPLLDKDHQFLRLYLENTTDKPIEIQDWARPPFTSFLWFHFMVDGKPLHLPEKAAYAALCAEKRVLAPKSKTLIGKAVLRVFKPLELDPYTPHLALTPGKYTLEVHSKKNVKPAKLDVVVPD